MMSKENKVFLPFCDNTTRTEKVLKTLFERYSAAVKNDTVMVNLGNAVLSTGVERINSYWESSPTTHKGDIKIFLGIMPEKPRQYSELDVSVFSEFYGYLLEADKLKNVPEDIASKFYSALAVMCYTVNDGSNIFFDGKFYTEDHYSLMSIEGLFRSDSEFTTSFSSYSKLVAYIMFNSQQLPNRGPTSPFPTEAVLTPDFCHITPKR